MPVKASFRIGWLAFECGMEELPDRFRNERVNFGSAREDNIIGQVASVFTHQSQAFRLKISRLSHRQPVLTFY